ncbi:Thioredoxin reductase [Saccharopolyspora antimicrobica]|uniref:Thioredoxin reductase n=1 Tax=Saccharopolyspora antimicrobica TaxID=455193 RepID=A0A1I5FN72_9PSEU|nr:NAD(P)/FAD-dependent oxidoreductase [Saccharopolyspora antimicrobica]RKT82240.1 thioredoxin reductase [Saccharopolyspora antimicrobica]SFO25172.1 Thioredoxin reductase [Saccharopolyspora antimicrobica]
MGETTSRAAKSAEHDVVITGGGAAGLSAALVLGRARRRVAVVDGGQPRNALAEHMQGFLSRDGLPPSELLEIGCAEVAEYGVEFVDGQVVHIERGGNGFSVRLADGAVLSARRLVVATGLRDELPEIPGVAERWGRDLLHCPYCHGYEVRDRAIGVLGTGPAAVHQALLLRQWSDDVVLFPQALALTDDEREQLAACGVHLIEGQVKQLVVADDRLRGIELIEGHVAPRDVAFVFPRMLPRDALLTELGCEKDEKGWVVTDRTGCTSVPGVWAVGNVADPRALVITAAGMGAAAAFAINSDLLDEDVARAVDDHRGSEAESLTSVR